MQTTITKNMAFGFPGAHANGQPYRADEYIATTNVTFGEPAFSDGVDSSSGFRKAKNSGDANVYIGMFVGAHQHVRMVLPTEDPSITVGAGTGVAVASRGCWYAKTDETWAVGDKLYISAESKYTKTSPGGGAAAVATVVDVDDTGKRAIVRLGE